MTFKTSSFNKGLIISDIKRFWWVSALYTLILFFNLPFNHLMLATQNLDKWQQEMLQKTLDLSSGRNDFQILLICTVPVLIAVLIFNYLHTNRSTAMMHSLPCTRKTLYLSHGVAGLLLLILPVIITALVLIILQFATYLKEYYSLIDILGWLGDTLLFEVLFYSFAVFVGMFTGNAIAQIVFTYILHFLPVGFIILLTYNLSQLLHGFASVNFERTLTNNLPLFVLLDHRLEAEYFTMGHVIGYLFLTAILFISAYYVYKIRKLEASGDIIAFSFIRPVFKYGVTICCMLLGGAYFAGISEGSFFMIVFGYIFSSFLGYLAAEVLMQKSFKVWHAYKGYLAYAAVLIVVLIEITTDATGYVHRVPQPEDVQKVYFGYNLDQWVRLEKNQDVEEIKSEIEYMYPGYGGGCFFESEENIKNITLLHDQLILEPHKENSRNRYIIYTLKNGKHLIRQYAIDEKEHASLLKPIYESMEYKRARFPVLTQKLEEIKWIEVNDDRTPKKPAILTNSTEIKEFMQLLQKELSNATYEELTSEKNNYIRIRIMDVNEKTLYYALPKNYELIFKWLKNKDYYEKIMLLPHEIEYIVLEKQNNKFSRKPAPTEQSSPKRVEIRDAKIIEELLNICGNYEYNREKELIMVGFYITGDNGQRQFRGYINEDTLVSEKLRSYLKQLDN